VISSVFRLAPSGNISDSEESLFSSDSDTENYVDESVSFSTSENNEKIETDINDSEYY
jgi:hypothetical protein